MYDNIITVINYVVKPYERGREAKIILFSFVYNI